MQNHSTVFINSPDSRLNSIIQKAHGEAVFARLPTRLRHRLAQRRNHDFFIAKNLQDGGFDDYSLKESERLGVIFIHIPKAAGISITHGIFGSKGGGHLPLSMYLWLYGTSKFDKMFKFSFSRNPINRIISAFDFLSSGGLTEADSAWANKWLNGISDVEAFIQEELSKPEVFNALHFRPQSFFILDPRSNNLGLDFIGKLENFDKDMAYISSKLKFCPNIPTLNASNRFSSKTIGMTSKKLIHDLYKDDFELLGY